MDRECCDAQNECEFQGSNHMSLPPHPANVPGDFYVEDGCCTLCEVPFSEAPELFAYWPNADAPQHCYVKRQPENPDELETMVSVIRCAELQCIHYRGNDQSLQLRLVEMGEGLACDSLPSDLQKQAEVMEAEDLRRRIKQRMADKSWIERILAWFSGDLG
jgi:hypothetical protein